MEETQKVVKSAIVIIPPESVWDSIQAIRKVHDKAYSRWMPHINLIYPFVPDNQFANVVATVTKSLSQFSAFNVKFQKLNYFSHGTMWLQADTQPAGKVESIQLALEQAFPICNDLSQKSDHGFTAHLSLGQFGKGQETKRNTEQFQKSWKPIEFTVSEVYLISRTNFDDPFHVRYRVPFGGAQPELVEEVSKNAPVESKSTGVKLFVSNISFTARDDDLLKLFQSHSINPLSIKIIFKNATQSKGFGFVEMSSLEEANHAIQQLNGQDLLGRNISVQLAK